MTIDIITGYTFDAGYTFGAHCNKYKIYKYIIIDSYTCLTFL
jgi:hypothetical protein